MRIRLFGEILNIIMKLPEIIFEIRDMDVWAGELLRITDMINNFVKTGKYVQ